VKRYQDKTFEPDGPIRSDLGLKVEDFFWEPFYQLVRQQMLAWRMQQARESGAVTGPSEPIILDKTPEKTSS
jgi:hypothetical protein